MSYNIDVMDGEGTTPYVQFTSPLCAIIAGPTGCGKTFFISQLLKYRDVMFTHEIKSVLYVYSVWQPLYDTIQKELGSIVEFTSHIPSQDDISSFAPDTETHRLIILDDQLPHLSTNKHFVEVFTTLCHHKKISTFLILQNIFTKVPWLRDASLNTQAFILFKNPRCSSQTRCLASQMFPENPKFFSDAFEKACKEPYSYMCIDLSPHCPKKYQLRSRILPGQQPMVFYLPKHT